MGQIYLPGRPAPAQLLLLLVLLLLSSMVVSVGLSTGTGARSPPGTTPGTARANREREQIPQNLGRPWPEVERPLAAGRRGFKLLLAAPAE